MADEQATLRATAEHPQSKGTFVTVGFMRKTKTGKAFKINLVKDVKEKDTLLININQLKQLVEDKVEFITVAKPE